MSARFTATTRRQFVPRGSAGPRGASGGALARAGPWARRGRSGGGGPCVSSRRRARRLRRRRSPRAALRSVRPVRAARRAPRARRSRSPASSRGPARRGLARVVARQRGQVPAQHLAGELLEALRVSAGRALQPLQDAGVEAALELEGRARAHEARAHVVLRLLEGELCRDAGARRRRARARPARGRRAPRRSGRGAGAARPCASSTRSARPWALSAADRAAPRRRAGVAAARARRSRGPRPGARGREVARGLAEEAEDPGCRARRSLATRTAGRACGSPRPGARRGRARGASFRRRRAREHLHPAAVRKPCSSCARAFSQVSRAMYAAGSAVGAKGSTGLERRPKRDELLPDPPQRLGADRRGRRPGRARRLRRHARLGLRSARATPSSRSRRPHRRSL